MPESPDFITVTPEELRRDFTVWLKVMPKSLWRSYLAMLEVDPRRRNPEDRVDPHALLGEYLAEQFVRAKWTAPYPKPTPPRARNS
jgi:hypothetical protein